MDHICPITGKYPCKCPNKRSATPTGSSLLIDLKAVLRKVFTDHAVYTSWLIVESLPINQPNAGFVTERLLQNPADIRTVLEPIIGSTGGAAVEDLFANHLKLAAAALGPVRSGDTSGTQKAVEAFYAQGDQVGLALHNLNPAKLSLEYAVSMMKQHNEYVVKLATLRQQQSYQEYIKTFDEYYKHMLIFSDMVYETLTS